MIEKLSGLMELIGLPGRHPARIVRFGGTVPHADHLAVMERLQLHRDGALERMAEASAAAVTPDEGAGGPGM